MVTSVVCFAAGHGKLFVGELQKPADVNRSRPCHQKLLRRVAGPADVNWNGPWREFLHAWHIRFEQQVQCNGFESWSHRYWRKSGNLQTISLCCQNTGGIRRVLASHPQQGRLGRTFIGYKNLPRGSISDTGYSQIRPPIYGSNTSTMSTLYLDDCAILFFTPCALNGLTTGMQEQGQSQCSTFATVPGPSPIYRC